LIRNSLDWRRFLILMEYTSEVDWKQAFSLRKTSPLKSFGLDEAEEISLGDAVYGGYEYIAPQQCWLFSDWSTQTPTYHALHQGTFYKLAIPYIIETCDHRIFKVNPDEVGIWEMSIDFTTSTLKEEKNLFFEAQTSASNFWRSQMIGFWKDVCYYYHYDLSSIITYKTKWTKRTYEHRDDHLFIAEGYSYFFIAEGYLFRRRASDLTLVTALEGHDSESSLPHHIIGAYRHPERGLFLIAITGEPQKPGIMPGGEPYHVIITQRYCLYDVVTFTAQGYESHLKRGCLEYIDVDKGQLVRQPLDATCIYTLSVDEKEVICKTNDNKLLLYTYA